MRRLRFVFLVIFAAILWSAGSASLRANVTLKNGNFYIGYTDLLYSGGFEPKIERVYNSKSPFKGIFGWGWGSDYQQRLQVMPDGSIVANEYGGGAMNIFVPDTPNADGLAAGIDALVRAATDAKDPEASPVSAFRTKLANDAQFLEEKWSYYLQLGRVEAPSVPFGTVVRSYKFGYQFITRVRGGYTRTFEDGRTEHFDAAGRLQRLTDKNGNFVDFVYDAKGQVSTITDNFDRAMTFTFNASGFVEKIVDNRGRAATYRYNPQGDLVYTRDVDGNEFTHTYDARHNMTQIGYGDHTTLQIAYYSLDQHENVKSVKDRDGSMTTYAYVTDPADKQHLTISVRVNGSDGKLLSGSSYEYFVKVDESGMEWTQRLIQTIDGSRTDTEYTPKGEPRKITTANGETSFEYDANGHVTRKATPTEVTELTYDEHANKVNYVKQYSKDTPNKVTWSKFTYDEKGNLQVAENSDGKKVTLEYDANGRITSAAMASRTLKFAYNKNSKPIVIEVVGLGSITVEYDMNGDISKVDSTGGRDVSIAVTTVFQELLEIIRPAGVSLGF